MNREALETWITKWSGRAVAYATTMIRDPIMAEDIAQDVFYRLLRNSDRYDLENEGEPILFRSLTNACLNFLERRKKFFSIDQEGRDDSGPMRDRIEGRERTPLEKLEARETEFQVKEALDELPEAQRAALFLSSQGFEIKAIADALDVSKSNAGVLVHRGRAALTEKLARVL